MLKEANRSNSKPIYKCLPLHNFSGSSRLWKKKLQQHEQCQNLPYKYKCLLGMLDFRFPFRFANPKATNPVMESYGQTQQLFWVSIHSRDTLYFWVWLGVFLGGGKGGRGWWWWCLSALSTDIAICLTENNYNHWRVSGIENETSDVASSVPMSRLLPGIYHPTAAE